MIRALVIAAACWLAAPAAAQDDPNGDIARASHAISFLWRPIQALSVEQFTRACSGAAEEIDAVESALPPVLTAESVARVRTLYGLLVIPTENPAAAYFFPDGSMTWFNPGLGAVAVVNEAEGFIAVQDAGGQRLAFQLGEAGARPILRIRNPQGAIVNFVGCAPTSAP